MSKRNQERIIQKIEEKGKEHAALKNQGKDTSKVEQELKQLTEDYNAEDE